MGLDDMANPLTAAFDYIDTVTSNIELFLKDKIYPMQFCIDDAKDDARRMLRDLPDFVRHA